MSDGQGSAVTTRAQRVASPLARSPLWIAAGGAYAGVTTYALLILTARALGADEYGTFSLFWSALVLVSLGIFLPIEQVVARRRAAPGRTGSLVVRGVRVGLACAVVAVVGLIVFLLIARRGTLTPSTLAALLAASLGYALLFPARGVLSGRLDLRAYVAVTSVDATVRTLGVVALWAAGIRQAGPYILCVGASVLAAGLAGVWAARERDHSAPGPTRTADGEVRPDSRHEPANIWREASGLVVALVCMQALLNSPVLIASTAADSGGFPGRLMAITSLARLPIFLAQAGQASYVGRIATAHQRHDQQAVRRMVAIVAAAVSGMAGLTVVGAAALGPQILTVVFGRDYVVGRAECVLVAAGVAAYLIASVANDVSVALGIHGRAAVTWLLAAAAGAVPAIALHDDALRSTLPMLLGSAVAAVALVPRIARSSGRDAL